jgi:hypothetical protein
VLAKTWRYLWPGAFTLLALAVCGLVLPWGVQARRQDHSIALYGRGIAILLSILVPWMRAAGLTIGHTVLYRTEADATALHAHEIVHVRQWEHWGLVFPIAYFTASLLAFARGQHYYFDNAFEREARRVAGF